MKLLTAEFGASVAIMSWGSMKEGYWPWPAALGRVAFAYAVLAIIALADSRIAGLLGAGFLIAQIVKSPVDANGNFKFVGGVPKGQFYPPLKLKGGKAERSSYTASDAPKTAQPWSPKGGGGSNKPIADQKPDNGGFIQV